jgi:hypothetical protein
MTAVVGRLAAALLQRDELVAEIDERVRVALAAQLEGEEAPVERQRGFDVVDLEGHVIEAHRTRLPFLGHRIPRRQSHSLHAAGEGWRAAEDNA